MFGGMRLRAAKPGPRRPQSKSRFAFIRLLTDKCYRDPYRWNLIKCVTFFAAGVFIARVLSDLNILPAELTDTPDATLSAY